MIDSVVVTERTGGVGTVRLNRPDAMNALDRPTKTSLLAALAELDGDRSVRCVVLRGTGRAFCVGQDLREHARLLGAGDLDAVWSTVPEHYGPIAAALHAMDKPVLAAVNGVAAGAGASLAFLADIRIVSSAAGFNLAFAGVALSCDTGCSWTLPRLVGTTRAMDLLLRPRTITAAESLALGIATEVVEATGFDDRVQAVAAELAAGPTVAYAAMRRAVGEAYGRGLPEALDLEAELMRRTGGTADHRAAVEAFLARRAPAFTGE